MQGQPSSQAGGISLARQALIPASVALCFVLYYLARWPFTAVVAAAAPLMLLYLAAPHWSRRSLRDFDRDIAALIPRREPRLLRRRYARALGMRMFAPRAWVDERRGMVAAHDGDDIEAREAFRSALESYGEHAPLGVLLGYANACYGAGQDDEAIPVYRQLLETTGALPGVERSLAHAMVRSGTQTREALALLDRVLSRAQDPDTRAELKMVEALAHVQLGDRSAARNALSEADPGTSDFAASLREEVEKALDGVSRPRA